MKHTKEKLEVAVKNSKSIAGVLRHLGINQSGGSNSHISTRIKKFEIDISHFTGQAWNKGTTSTKRKTAKQILVSDPEYRLKGYLLVRALLEMGIDYKCVECNISNLYNNKKLTLQVDHINGNWKDNRLENLRFLCPNCHSQTNNFGVKNKFKD